MTTRTTSRVPLAALAALLGLVIAAVPAEARQSGAGNGARPDFSGVWRTIAPPAAPRVNTTLRWLPAPGELPDFTPAYKQRYDKIQASRETGSEETERSEERRVGKECRHRWTPYQ